MIKFFLYITIIIFFISIRTPNIQKEKYNPKRIEFKTDTFINQSIEEKYSEVKELLLRVPKEQRDSFVIVLKDFADERNFDWRFCLLLMWGESGINTTEASGSFVGLIMFGYHARIVLNLTKEELLRKNFIEQAKYAVVIWEANEKMMKTKIKDFQSLQIATFVPAWMNHHGNPYPASDIIKKQNYPLCDSNGNITRESILNVYRRRCHLYDELTYFRNKF